jgi:hypothetical protein
MSNQSSGYAAPNNWVPIVNIQEVCDTPEDMSSEENERQVNVPGIDGDTIDPHHIISGPIGDGLGGQVTNATDDEFGNHQSRGKSVFWASMWDR